MADRQLHFICSQVKVKEKVRLRIQKKFPAIKRLSISPLNIYNYAHVNGMSI